MNAQARRTNNGGGLFPANLSVPFAPLTSIINATCNSTPFLLCNLRLWRLAYHCQSQDGWAESTVMRVWREGSASMNQR